VFEIITEPNRRAILSLLVSSQQPVGEIERQLRMPQPTVSRHLRVLPRGWFRGFWSAHVDALERHLDLMDQ
jgi:DNA-binding transcriptional ArsR family regulator